MIECVPVASAAVLHVAVRLLPLPLIVCAPQPLMPAPSLVNATLPVGPVPTIVAVNVTLAPEVDGFSELASAVVLAAFTVCDKAELDELAFAASPA